MQETSQRAKHHAPPLPEAAHWAAMVAMMVEKNCRLSRAVAHKSVRSSSNILRELERERSRIARELHAGAGQPLTGIKMNLEILEGCAPSLPPRAKEAMGRLYSLADSALAEVRAVSHRLHPPDWQSLTTAQAIRRLLGDMGVEEFFEEALTDVRELPSEPEHSIRLALYRCAQEGVANVIRHSGATHLAVTLIPDGGEVELTIRDNGKGIAPASASHGTAGSAGLGLNAIREHVSAAGGRYTIKSGSSGTTITVRIPLLEE